MITKKEIKDYIINELIEINEEDKGVFVLEYDQSLIETSVIDSLNMVKLIIYIEDKIGQIFDTEVDFSNFDTIDNIYKLILNYSK